MRHSVQTDQMLEEVAPFFRAACIYFPLTSRRKTTSDQWHCRPTLTPAEPPALLEAAQHDITVAADWATAAAALFKESLTSLREHAWFLAQR